MGLFDEVVGAFLKGDAGKYQAILSWVEVSDLGQKLGVDTSTASSLLAEQLPKIIDALSPQGEVSPQANNDLLSAGMELLKGKLFR